MLLLFFVTVFKSCSKVLVSHSINIPIGFTKVPNLCNSFGYKYIWTQMYAKPFFLCITWNVIYVTSIKNETNPRDPSEVSRISVELYPGLVIPLPMETHSRNLKKCFMEAEISWHVWCLFRPQASKLPIIEITTFCAIWTFSKFQNYRNIFCI